MPDLPTLGRLADTLLPEGLAAFIDGHRGEGKSWDWIARELWLTTDKQVEANGQTVRNWDLALKAKAS